MKKLEMITGSMSRTVGRVGLYLRKFAPEILIGFGITGVILGTASAIKGTPKAIDIMDDMESDKESIKQGLLIDNPKKEMFNLYLRTSGKLVKNYLPAVTMTAGGIVCILGAHNIMSKRYAQVMMAYKVLDTRFLDYRKNITDEYGADVDRRAYLGLTQEEIEVIDENGKKTKELVDVLDPNKVSQYAIFFDESSSEWTQNHDTNKIFLKCIQQQLTDKLVAQGHLFLNEAYDALGLPRTSDGAIVGWVYGKGDNYVDLGVFEARNADFVNGYERIVLLDFNVDGLMYADLDIKAEAK